MTDTAHTYLLAPSICSRCGDEFEDGQVLQPVVYKRDAIGIQAKMSRFDVSWEHKICDAHAVVPNMG